MGRCNFGMESIKRQSDDFFDALTESVGKLRNGGDFSTSGIKKSYIMQVIKQYTGLNILLFIKEGWRACVFTPQLTSSHVFDYVRYANSGPTIIDVTKTTLKGTVDTSNARVGGAFSDVKSEVFLGTALFKPGALNDRQIAGIILHELGHAFTYFQFISTVAYGNLVIQQTIRNVFLTNDYQTKQYQIKAAEEVLGLEDEPGVEDWINTSKDNLEVILTTRYYRNLKTRSDSIYYDVRNCEQLADTFAAKHGAAVYLAQANTKLDKEHNLYGNKNFFVHILTETAGLIKRSLPIGDNGSTSREILLTMQQPKIYDDPKDRISFLKFQLIDDLKQLPRGDNTARKSIVESIKDIDVILKDINVRRGLLTFIHETMTGVGKSTSNQQKEQKKLEEMLNNNLYYQSAKLKTLY